MYFNTIIAHECGKRQKVFAVPIIPIFSTAPQSVAVLSLSHLHCSPLCRPNVFHLQITSPNQSSPTRAISLPSQPISSLLFIYFSVGYKKQKVEEKRKHSGFDIMKHIWIV